MTQIDAVPGSDRHPECSVIKTSGFLVWVSHECSVIKISRFLVIGQRHTLTVRSQPPKSSALIIWHPSSPLTRIQEASMSMSIFGSRHSQPWPLAAGCTYREHPSLSTRPSHGLPTPSFISSNRAASIFIAHTLPISLRVNLTFEVKAMDSDGADSCIQRESVIVDQRVSMNISDKAPGLRPLPPRLRR